MNKKKHVVLGITSGIAAFKVIDLIKLLRQEEITVSVIMTKSAAKMIAPDEFEKASGNKVYIELFEKGFDYRDILEKRKVEHIDLADSADLMVVLPATANSIAKIAFGFADDFLTTTLLAVTAPVIICPSMNVHMWRNPLVQENVERLYQHGFQILGPDSGMLACGYTGEGRLIDVGQIKLEIIKQLQKTAALNGKKVIVTAGGTTERIDTVRYITNRSSGKMGVAIAEELYLRGADVLLFRAKNAVRPRYQINEKIFSTAEDLLELIKSNVMHANAIFHAAAVSDFQLGKSFDGKLSSDMKIHLELEPRTKIFDRIKEFNPDIFLVGFKAESGLSENQLIEVAKKRLAQSSADVIIANDVSKPDRGFEVDTNEVFLIKKNGKVQKIPLASKREVAEKIIDAISQGEAF